MRSRAEKIPAFATNSPEPSAQEILASTNEMVPYPLDVEAYKFPGTEDIDYSRYTSPEFFGREMDRMWSRVWHGGGL